MSSLSCNVSQHDVDITPWMHQLKYVWGLWKKSDRVTRTLHELFSSVTNPYFTALTVMKNCNDFKQAKPNSLAYTVMEEFSKWIENRTDLESMLTSDIKLAALNIVVTQRNMSLVKLVCNVYKMKEEKHIFLEPVRNLILRKQYKEACQIASQLMLHNHFGIEEFLVPLVFQDKLTVVEEFLTGSIDHQNQLVTFLDNLLGKRNIGNEVDILIYQLDIPETKPGKLYYKPLSKLVARLTNMYDLPPELCPNLNRKRSEGALQFLMHKKYHEHSIGHVSWREMIREATATNLDLQCEVISFVSSVGDIPEAAYWAKEFNIPRSRCPPAVQQLLEANCTDTSCETSVKEESWDEESNSEFHMLSLPDSSILLIDNDKSFQEFLNEVSNVQIVGVDSEWKPYFGTRKNELALIQVASQHKVYIIDVVLLGSDNDIWKQANIKLFGNERIIKLGFGIGADLNVMSHSLPSLADVFRDRAGYLDLVSLWKRLTKEFAFEFPYVGDESGESLAHLVELCLGKKLDKSDQFSNWEKRPLRKSQMRYAALDAFCLIEVFNLLKENANRQDIPFEDVCAELTSKTKSPKRIHKPRKNRKNDEPLEVVRPFSDPVFVPMFKVLCDRGLEGLGQQLRKVGVDTLMVPPAKQSDHCASQAAQQGRVVITRGRTSYVRLCQFVPLGHCYMVKSENVHDQVREVLEHFNVIVKREDVFSRCKLCNGASFVKVSQSTMRQLIVTTAAAAQANGSNTSSSLSMSMASEYIPRNGEMYSNDQINKPLLADMHDGWIENINVPGCCTRQGASIQMNVPLDCLDKITEFNICECCGRVYWDGSHFDRFLNGRLKDIFSE